MSAHEEAPSRGAALDFRRLYHESFRFVWSNLLYLGVPPELVEDALQDVFVVVHRRLPRYEGRGSLRSWLYTIVRRVASLHRRTHQRAERKQRALGEVVPATRDLEAEVGARELLARVLRALDELPEGERAAFTLHHLEELSGPEVARILRLNLDTAYTRIKSARIELRRHLRRSGVARDLEPWLAAVRVAARPPKHARRRGWLLLAGPTDRLGEPATGSVTSTWITVAVWSSLLGAAVMLAPDAPTAGASRHSEAAHERLASNPLPPSGEHRVASSEPPSSSQLEALASDPTRPTATRSLDAPAPASPSSQATDGLAEEVALLTAASDAIAEGRTERALELLERHAKEFAHGQLGPERAGYRAIALCEAGRSAQGQGEAHVFLRSHPESTLASRVRAACERIP